MEKTAIYARVSTSEQAEQGISLDAQIAKAVEYCEQRGLHIVDTVVETMSAKDVDHRPGLKRVLEMVDRKRVEHVVCWKQDRLSRNTVDSLEILALFAKRGAQLHEVCEQAPVKVDSADSELMFTIKASMAQRERRIIGERTALAMARKRERGERVSRFAPFGYCFEGDRIVENVDEQHIIRTVHHLGESGLSIRKIRATLTADGMMNRQGHPFGVAELHKMLKQHEQKAA
ncbi:MAG: recombinase family protein [Thermodesulfobacteriota bacterium]